MQEPDRATATETDPQGKGRQNRVLQISAKSENSNLEMKAGGEKPPAGTEFYSLKKSYNWQTQ